MVTAENHRLCVTDRKTRTRFLVDTGANVSVLPVSNFKSECSVTNIKLYAANNSEIKSYGIKTLDLNIGLRRSYKWEFIVCDVKQAILGADFIQFFKLLVDLYNKRLVDTVTSLRTEGTIIRYEEPSIKSIRSDNPYKELIEEFADITQSVAFKETTSHSVCHRIVTSGPPVFARPRPLPPDRYTKVKKEFGVMQELGICRPGQGEWASPLHVVPKKDGQLRPCGDYRALNTITKPDRYPIPRLQNFTYMLPNKKLYSRLDLNRAYHNIPVATEDIEKTAISTPFGLYEFPRMSFGLRNAAQTFQRFMDHHVLKGIEQIGDHSESTLFCYIDDILLASENEEIHKQHLRKIFERFREMGVTINISKCVFGTSQVEFLGYTVSSDGISPLPDKVKAIVEYPRPETVEQLRRFLGMANFYRSHLPNAVIYQTELNKYLHNTKKKDKSLIVWNNKSIEAFDQCKLNLQSAATLSHPSADAPLSLMTDASDKCVGAVLQQYINGAWLPLGYFSKKLSDSQIKYSTYDKELTAIYLAMVHFRSMLEGRQITIYTDHKPLIFAFTKLGQDKEIPRRARQLLYISEFTSDIRHIDGTDNTVADALSRVESICCPTVLDYDELAREQGSDTQIVLENNSKAVLKHIMLPNTVGKVLCEVSTGNVRPYLPIKFRKKAFDSIHNLSHPGTRTTRKLVKQRFFWPGMNKDINNWTKSCLPCQKSKISRHTVSNLVDFPPCTRFEHIHTDIVGPLPTSRDGYRYCVTIMDRFTRWPEAIPVSDISADTVSKVIFKKWICRFGCPKRITTDQGRQFESDLFNALMKMFGVDRTRTTPYHPQSNGLIERWHRSLKNALTARLTAGTDWAEELPIVLLGIRAACRTDTGVSAAEMVYGETVRLPGDFFLDHTKNKADQHVYLQNLRQVIRKLRPQPREISDSRKIFVSKNLKSCTHVFIRNDVIKKSLCPAYDGPYRVLNRNDKVFKVKLPHRDIQVSIDRLKPAFVLEEEKTVGCDSKLDVSSESQNNVIPKLGIKSPSLVTHTTRSGRQVKPPVRFLL